MKRLAAILALACSACGSGTHPELYNFVIDYFTAPATCYRSMMLGPTTVSTGRLSGGQFSVWDGPDAKAFLEIEGGAQGSIDMGDAPNVVAGGVLEGSAASGGWAFVTEHVSRTTQGGTSPIVTTRTKLTLTFPRSATFKGTLAASSGNTCEGTNCPADFATTNPACSIDAVPMRGARIAVDYERSP